MLSRGNCYRDFVKIGPCDRFFEKTHPNGHHLEIQGRLSQYRGIEVFFGVYGSQGMRLIEEHHVLCSVFSLEEAMIWAAKRARPVWLGDVAEFLWAATLTPSTAFTKSSPSPY
ncbi:hypothetical protein [Pseudomonas sp. RIT-PI-AD]|uniref:hypothetical protein n=1 Tax=Pseudomonas sp. RIT-PI-AD TaxID=3035294 RepID=UPI0021DA33E9|nr:hypothetical protein [Pseudomonas sp. RIT-PI-AD]